MPQYVVNMEVNTQNKVRSKLKSYRFKKRHAPYLNRWAKYKIALYQNGGYDFNLRNFRKSKIITKKFDI